MKKIVVVNRTRSLLVGTLILVSIVGGSRWSVTRDGIVEASNHLSRAQIEEGARKEGALVIYAADPVTALWDEFVAAFRTKHPYLRVEREFRPGFQNIERVISEAKAGRHRADVTDGILSQFELLKKEGLLDEYASPEVTPAGYAEAFRDPVRMKTYYSYFPVGFVYNTRWIKPEETPKTYQDLLNPRWKGQLAFFDPKSGPAFPVYWYGLMKPRLGLDFFYALARQEIRLRGVSSQAMQNLVVSGEEKLVIAANLAIVPAVVDKNPETPIDWVIPQPLYLDLSWLGLLKSAQHPNAARLFLDFVASKDGQSIVAKYRLSSRKDVIHPGKATQKMAEEVWKRGPLIPSPEVMANTAGLKEELTKIFVQRQRLQ
jgi:ABC-type Fe3+ transport system substrate-binding protein